VRREEVALLARGPSEVSEDLARSAGIAARERPLVEFTARLEFSPVSYRPYSVRRSRFAVGPLPRPHGFPTRTTPVNLSIDPLRLSSSSVLLQSFAQRLLAERLARTCPGRNRAAADKSAQRLSWTFLPYSTSRKRRSTFTRLPTRAVCRLQGLVTLWTVSSLRVPVGFVSRRRRSWACPLRSFPLSEGSEPSPDR
jgi:hypothetical protein